MQHTLFQKTINNLNNYNLLIQTTEGGKSYVYFAVTITNNDEVMGAEFYLYLTNQAGDNTGEGVELFTVVVGNQTLIQRQVGDNAPTGDFMFEDTGDGFMFMAYLNESALSCVDNGYLTITSISSSYFGANTQLTITDPSGSTISGATNFKLQLRGDGTSSGVAFIATISDGENEMSAIIALALPTSSGGDDNYDDTTNAGYYDEYISIHVEGMYGTSMDFEVNDGVINFTDWSILYCLEATVMRPDVCVQLLDSNQNELTGDPQRGVVYCFQNAGTYTLNVYNAEGEIVETFTINVNGNFDKTVVTVEFGELTLTETCDETWEPVGDFVYTMDMSTQEAYIINFKGYLGAEALESARVSMKGMPIITLDSIDSIFADSLYYDASGLNQIAELQNVELEGTQDAYGNYYVSFYIINEWNLGDGYIMDAIMNVSLYLCSRESYLASLDYPLTIGVGTNSLDFRVAMDDIGEFGDFDFDSYYSGVPYIELERSSLNLVADTETSVGGDTSEMPTLEHANVTLTWHKAYQDYSYCVLGMEAFGLLMSEEFTFDELIAEGLIYRCTDLNNNTATIPMTFMDGMAFLMVGLDGLTVENIAEESFAIVLFLIKGEATLEDFENMMNDDSMGGGVELSIPDIEITVGKQILTRQNGDFMINYENGELVGWLDCTYDEIVQIGDNGNYINLDSIVVSEECELRDGYERSLNFTNAQVAVFGFEYGLCAEIRVYSQNGSSFRILLVVDNSVSDDTVGGDDNNNVQMTFTSLPTDIELEIVVGSQTLTADDFDYCQEYNLIVGRLNSTEQQLVSDGYATITSLTTNLEGRVIDANSDEIDLSGSFEVCSADTGIMGVALIIGIQRNQTIYTIFLLFAEEDKNSTSSGVTIG